MEYPMNQLATAPHRRRILIVEDELLIGMALEMTVTDGGYDCVGVIGAVNEALAFISSNACDAAILDLNLGGASSEPVAAALQAAGVPFVILSGYSAQQQRAMFSGATFLQKPFASARLLSALRSVLAA